MQFVCTFGTILSRSPGSTKVLVLLQQAPGYQTGFPHKLEESGADDALRLFTSAVRYMFFVMG